MGTLESAVLLGVLEGLTEFLPVSSTGHLLLAGHFLGFESPSNSFEIAIQLGAILALFSVYATKLGALFLAAPKEVEARRIILSLLLAFLPSVAIGFLAYDAIKTILFETPRLIAVNLIWGGVVLIFVDRIAPQPVYRDALRLPLMKSLFIGLCQCLAMIPGVSRSGATIVGAMMVRVEKRAAAEFSFLLSLPTMGAAVSYDLLKSRHDLDFTALADIAVGFAVAFVVAAFVVRYALSYISRHGYAFFGWWRIIVGSLALVALI